MELTIPELLEEILLRQPLKSLLRFKTVSKQWRSILESKRFAERRRIINAQKKLKIMAAGDGNRFQGDEEVDMLYLNCDVASMSSLSCDGLVCIPVPGWVNVLNPSTGEFLRFPTGPDPIITNRIHCLDSYFDVFPGCWAMGFGKDKTDGSYKIVRMWFDDYKRDFKNRYCEILDVNIGQWRKLRPPPYYTGDRVKSACVNGSIYWAQVIGDYEILALDLHTQEFRDVPTPPSTETYGKSGQVANLQDRLVLTITYPMTSHWSVKIWTMDTEEETWSLTYSIHHYLPVAMNHCPSENLLFWTRPLAVSKQGNLFFHDKKRLFKYYPQTDQVRILVQRDICVISPLVGNLVPLRRLVSIPKSRAYGFQHLDHAPSSSSISNFLYFDKMIFNFFRRLQHFAYENSTTLLTAAVVALGTHLMF